MGVRARDCHERRGSDQPTVVRFSSLFFVRLLCLVSREAFLGLQSHSQL